MSRHPWLNRWTLLPLVAALLLLISVACGASATATPTVREVIVERTVEVPVDVERTVVVERTVQVPVDVERTVVVEKTVVVDRTVVVRPTNTPRPRPTPVPTVDPIAAQAGGHVRMAAYADTKDWDPTGSGSLSAVIAYSQLYNQVVQFDTTDVNKVVCDLCTSWDITNAGQTFTFKLADDARWQDGVDLTADDVVFMLSRYMNPETSMGRSGLFRNYTKPVEDDGVKRIDDTTVEFNLQFPSGAFIKFLALDYAKILPKHLLEQGIDLNQGENVIEHRSGSGPFVLEEYKRGNLYAVSKNQDYFKPGRPFVDSIDHFIITDAGTLIAQFKAGQVDMMNGGFSSLTATEYLQLDADTVGSSRGHIIAHRLGGTQNMGFMINILKEPFTDPRIRKAIYLAIDRQQINSIMLDDTGDTPCPMMGMGYSFDECLAWPGIRSKDTPGGQADIAEAKRLMAEAGFPDGFETHFDARMTGKYDEFCQVIKQQLKDTLGITGDLTSHESAAGYALYGTSRPEGVVGDWQLSCQAEGMTIIDADALMGGVYLTGGTRNYTNWEPAFIREKYELQKVEQDVDVRRDILKEIEDWLVPTDVNDLSKGYSDNHWVTQVWANFFQMVHEDIKGYNPANSVQNGFKHEDIWLDR